MKRTRLTKEKRREHVVQIFGAASNFYLPIESHIFEMADLLSRGRDYPGGYWASYITENGAFYMAPSPNHLVLVESPNGSVQSMSADAFGIMICRLAFSHLAFRFKADGCVGLAEIVTKQFHLLTAYVNAHEEAEAIYKISDLPLSKQ